MMFVMVTAVLALMLSGLISLTSKGNVIIKLSCPLLVVSVIERSNVFLELPIITCCGPTCTLTVGVLKGEYVITLTVWTGTGNSAVIV